MLDKALEFTLNEAFQRAKAKCHEYLTVEHLLLALLDNPAASSVLRACGANIQRLQKDLMNFVDETTPIIPGNDIERETQPTLGFQRVLQRAVFQVQSAGRAEVSGANVLVAIFSEQESQAVFFLKQDNINRLDVVNYLSHGIPPSRDDSEDEGYGSGEEDSGLSGFSAGPSTMSREKSPLDKYATNLNKKAQQGRIDPLIGRTDEVERAIQVLCRRRKNNPLFVGEAGVGKTAIAEGIAKLLIEEKVPDIIKGSTVYSLDLGGLLAGTKYRGDFEKRLKGLLQQLKDDKKAILFIDEIHTIIGAGAASGGVMDASNLIKPMLANGELRCMGSTTFQEYRQIFEKDNALTRRFQKIDVHEPSVVDTIAILGGLKENLEAHHGITYTEDGLKAAAELSARYITDRFLPDKAIDVVDEAGAYQNLLPEDQRKSEIGVEEIETVVAKIARIPSQNVSQGDKEMLRHLDRDLKMLVYGQDEAINTLSSAIKLARSGLRDESKPVGSFLFSGPTGVGKTEVTKQLSNLLGIELIRFDMSEYMESHAVARLIGAPPGYVGYEQGGLLTDAVVKTPHAVLLLDEIEKAHPDIFNILLQVMDHGSLTDNNGRKADFRHVILVMTSNVGAQMMQRSTVGFTEQDHSTDGMGELDRVFAPEFRNRLDAIVQFKALDSQVITHVVDKFLTELEVQLEQKGVYLEVDVSARAWLAEHGYNPTMGARPMERLIQNSLKKSLAEEILFGKLSDGGHVMVVERDGELKFEISKDNKSPVRESEANE
ncbi:MAG: ATP-dependent Clp protease ATP-binding subunit ClpA [marine bacterium B5-7]|nr:MAG: ATP-dependent Clp protease ATP-binding subunit ClpA [marine bacterium B5-7]